MASNYILVIIANMLIIANKLSDSMEREGVVLCAYAKALPPLSQKIDLPSPKIKSLCRSAFFKFYHYRLTACTAKEFPVYAYISELIVNRIQT